MKPYPSYKDSGVPARRLPARLRNSGGSAVAPAQAGSHGAGGEWIGEIPNDWNVKRLKYITTSKKDKSEDGSEELLSVSEYLGVVPRSVIREGEDHLTRSESLEGYLKVSKGNLVNNIMLMWKRGLGVSDYDGIVSPSYSVFSFNNSSPKYFHYLLRTDLYITEFRKNSTGIIDSRLRLYDDDFGNIYSYFPPLPEQKQIVSFLDHKTQKIDELIEKTEQKIELLKGKRTVLINHCVTKGLNPNVEMKDSGIEWIGEIPSSWDILNFGMICSLQQGLQIPFNNRFFDKGENRFEYITTQSIHNPEQPRQYIENPKSSVICKVDDIIYGRTGNTGEVVTNVSGVFHNNFFLIDFNRKKIEKSFLIWYLNNSRFKEHILLLSGTTTIPDLNHGDFLSTRLLLPNKIEQTQIVEYLDEKTQKIDSTLEKETQRIELLKEYRQSLISEVVTGKIDVRDWNS